MNSSSSSEHRPSLRARFRSATRDALIDAAARLFAARGAAHLRMEDIAAEAGVAVGTVYNYFADRSALVNAVLETRSRQLVADLDAVLAQRPPRSAAEFAAALTRFVEALGRHLDTNRALFALMLEEQQHHGISARAMSRKQTLVGQVLARAETLVAHGIRARVLRKDDPAFYGALLVGMVRGAALTALSRGGGDMAPHAGEIVAVFLNGAAR